jgi:hypothetical protein
MFANCSGFDINGGRFYNVAGDINLRFHHHICTGHQQNTREDDTVSGSEDAVSELEAVAPSSEEHAVHGSEEEEEDGSSSAEHASCPASDNDVSAGIVAVPGPASDDVSGVVAPGSTDDVAPSSEQDTVHGSAIRKYIRAFYIATITPRFCHDGTPIWDNQLLESHLDGLKTWGWGANVALST